MWEIEDEYEVLEDSLCLSMSEAPGDLATWPLSGLGGRLLGLLKPPVTGISSGSDDPDLEVSRVAGPSSLMMTPLSHVTRRIRRREKLASAQNCSFTLQLIRQSKILSVYEQVDKLRK